TQRRVDSPDLRRRHCEQNSSLPEQSRKRISGAGGSTDYTRIFTENAQRNSDSQYSDQKMYRGKSGCSVLQNCADTRAQPTDSQNVRISGLQGFETETRQGFKYLPRYSCRKMAGSHS